MRLQQFQILLEKYPDFQCPPTEILSKFIDLTSTKKFKTVKDANVLYIYTAIHLDTGKRFYVSQTRVNGKSARKVGLTLKPNETLVYTIGKGHQLLKDLELILGDAYLVLQHEVHRY